MLFRSFAALGKDPARGLQVFFWEPVRSVYALGELGLKAAPLLLMALGLALAFRSNVWNIGAEGQFVMGAVFAGGVALATDASAGGLTLPAMLSAYQKERLSKYSLPMDASRYSPLYAVRVHP